MPSDPYLADIMMVGFNFAPRGWAFCDGQILPINQNQSLYSLLGTTYGGDGRTTFALPDLRSRVPIHVGRAQGGSERQLGARGGTETHTLTTAELPAHSHAATLKASSATAISRDGTDAVFATALDEIYGPSTANSVQAEQRAVRLAATGGSQAHDNMPPFTTVNFCIALQRLFPSRN